MRRLIAAVKRLRPFVVVADVTRSQPNGTDALTQLKRDNPMIKVVLLSQLSELPVEPCQGGEIYAKVIGPVPGSPTQTQIRFTSVSPRLEVWMHEMASRLSVAVAGKG